MAPHPKYQAHLAGADQGDDGPEIPPEFGLEDEGPDVTDLRSIIENEIQDAQTFIDYDISEMRERATQYYKGDPMGDEEEGRSQVISRDVHDTVNGILPSLMRIFFGPERVVEFVPQGPEDVDNAEQATDYVNYIVQRDNSGFQIFWDAFKDALVRKVGIIKYWWDQSVEVTSSDYTGLDQETLQGLLDDLRKSIEPEVTDMSQDPETGELSVTISMKRYVDRVRLMALPPEEFLINRHARDIDTARFVCHRSEPTVSDLIAMGYDRDAVLGAAGDSELEFNEERIARQPGDYTTPAEDTIDPMLQRVIYYECYVRSDQDGDGIAELRKVCALGNGFTILHDEQADERPFAAFCPDPEPHTFFGQCPADNTMDIQKIKTGVMRATLDSLITSIFPRTVVKTSGVNIADVMNTENGAIIRADNVDNVKVMNMPFVGDKSFPMLEYMDRVRESRTGLSRVSQGLNAEALVSTTATAANQQFQAAQEHIELIARIFAEGGMKRLFRGILRLAAKNQRQERMVSLRGSWVPVDPRGWKTDMDCIATVALGAGTVTQKMQFLNIIAQKQEGIMLQAGQDNPLVGPQEYYQTLSSMTELAGFKNVDLFWKDPSKAAAEGQQQPQGPGPEAIEAHLKMQSDQMKIQAAMQKSQMDNQTKLQIEKMRGDRQMQLEFAKLQMAAQGKEADLAMKLQEFNAKYQTSMDVAQLKAITDQIKIDADLAIQQSEAHSAHVMAGRAN
jgi:hypothetical protein